MPYARGGGAMCYNALDLRGGKAILKPNLGTVTACALLSMGAAWAQGSGSGTPSGSTAGPEYQIVQGAPPAKETKALSAQQTAYQQAVTDFRAGRLAQAEAGLVSVEQQAPTDPTVHSLLGYIYLKENKSAQALAEMQTVVRLAPNDPAGRKNLGRALLQTGKNDQALAQFQTVLAANPNDADAQYGLALALGQSGRTDDAAAAFGRAASLKPSAAAYQNQAAMLQKGGRYAEAADAYQKASALDPTNSAAFLNAGLLYAQAGNNDKAIPALTQALALDTDEKYEAHMALGQAQAKSDPDQALTQFVAAAQARPTDALPVYDQAVLQTQAGRRPQAEAAYRKVIDLAPSDPKMLGDAQMALGLLLAQDGNAADAVPLLTQAAQADPKNPVPHQALGNLYAKLANPQKAIDERTVAVSLAPDDVQTRLLLADQLMAQKQYAAAAMQYDQAAQRQPDNAQVQNARGTAYEMSGNLAVARTAFQAALTADPKYARAENNLGVVYEKQGHMAQAVAAYKKAVQLDPALAVARRNLARLTKK